MRRALSFIFLALVISGCKGNQFNRLVGKESSSSHPNSPAGAPELQDPCITAAAGNLVDGNIPPSLDLSQAVVIVASLAGEQICTETVSANSAGHFTLLKLSNVGITGSLNVTVKINGTTHAFTRSYDPAGSSNLADITLN